MSWPQKLIATCFILLFSITPLVFLPATSELFEFNKLTLTLTLTTFILTLWGIRSAIERRRIFARTPLDIPLIVFLIASSLSLFFSIDPHISMFGYYGRWNSGLISLISYALLYWAYVSNVSHKSSIIILKSSLFTAIIISIYGALEHFGWSPSCLLVTGTGGVDCWVQDVQNRVFATLGQPNWLAAYIVALMFIPISLFINSPLLNKERGVGVRYWMWYLVFGVLFACLLFTKSRSGLLAFGISSLVFWSWVLYSKIINHKSLIKSFLVFILITVSSGFLIKNPLRDYILPGTTLLSPIATPQQATGTALESGGTESGAIRQIVWRGALAAWRENTKTILIGTGPETFALAYYAHRPIEHNATSEWELLYNKAHNEFLNQLTTTGIVGLFTYLLLLASMGKLLLQNLFSKSNIEDLISKQNSILNVQYCFDSRNSVFSIGIFAGWLSLSITNFWGFSVVTSQLLLFLLPAIAKSLQTVDSSKPSPSLGSREGLGVSYILSAIIILFGGYLLTNITRYWYADTLYANSQKYLNIFTKSDPPDLSDLQLSYDYARRAYEKNGSEPVIDTQLADTAAYLSIYLSEADATTAGKLRDLAVSAAKKSLATSPNHPIHYKSLARVLILLSALDPSYLPLADEALKIAQTLSPTDPRLPYNRGVIAKYQDDAPAATSFYEAALRLKPDFGEAILGLKQVASDSAKNK